MRKIRILVTIAEFEGKREYLGPTAAASRRVEVIYRSCHDAERVCRALRETAEVEVLYVNRAWR